MYEFRGAQDLSSADKQFVENLMSYENPSVLARLREDKGYSEEEAVQLWNAWKQFAAVAFFMKGRKVTSKKIDDVWHAFLLHTRQYADFCQQYWGGHFFHHEPSSDEGSPSFYIATRDYANRLFGSLDSGCWPQEATKGRCLSGGDCRSKCRSQ